MAKEKPSRIRQEEKISIDAQDRILLFGRPVGIIRKGAARGAPSAVVDSECQILELNRFLMSRCGSVRFQPGIAAKLAQEEAMNTAHLIHRARVYQLRAEVDPALRFIGYQELLSRQGCVNPTDYALVFDRDVGSSDPETVYRLLRDAPPDGMNGHALTRSDVMELYNPKENRFFYIDSFALKPIRFDAPKMEMQHPRSEQEPVMGM